MKECQVYTSKPLKSSPLIPRFFGPFFPRRSSVHTQYERYYISLSNPLPGSHFYNLLVIDIYKFYIAPKIKWLCWKLYQCINVLITFSFGEAGGGGDDDDSFECPIWITATITVSEKMKLFIFQVLLPKSVSFLHWTILSLKVNFCIKLRSCWYFERSDTHPHIRLVFQTFQTSLYVRMRIRPCWYFGSDPSSQCLPYNRKAKAVAVVSRGCWWAQTMLRGRVLCTGAAMSTSLLSRALSKKGEEAENLLKEKDLKALLRIQIRFTYMLPLDLTPATRWK